MSTYQYYKALHADDPITPYVMVQSGALSIIRWDLAIDLWPSEQYDVIEEDILITKARTLASVYWPDGSTTRLGPNTRMTIQKMRVASDYSRIELELALENGKVWNTVVRTLYPDSYFRVKLPKNGTIAGVRGTIFDIDLTNDVIRSSDHAVVLSDMFWNVIHLLPWTLRKATDITKIAEGFSLDNTWTLINQTQDAVDASIRSSALSTRTALLSGNAYSWIQGVWDNFVRWILSKFPQFSDMTIFESIIKGGTPEIWSTLSTEKLLGVYQAFQDKKFVQERDILRGVFLERVNTGDSELKKYIPSLTLSSFYDMIGMTGGTLPNTSRILKEMDGSVKGFLDSAISDEQKASLRSLFQNLGK
jgi:hypothetical protein